MEFASRIPINTEEVFDEFTAVSSRERDLKRKIGFERNILLFYSNRNNDVFHTFLPPYVILS